MAVYGGRTRDASGAITLDTSVTPLRSIYTTQVQGMAPGTSTSRSRK